MLAIGIGHERAIDFLRGRDGVSVAAVNGPDSFTAAGPSIAIERLAADCASAGLFHRLLAVDVPFHSSVMGALKPRLREGLSALTPGVETIPLYSSVTADRIEGTALTAAYWCDNMREPVLFAPAIQRMIEDGYTTFVEPWPRRETGRPDATVRR